MEIKKNKSQSLFSQGNSTEKEKKNSICSFVKQIFDNQVFFNSRLKALEYIEKQGNVTTAMLTMNISKVKGFLGSNYEIKFSLLYSTENGKIFQTKNFYSVEMPGKEGMIPSYILDSVEEEDALEIKFNLDDLTILYNERDVNIDEDSSFDEVVKICNKNNVVAIQLIDRVFYTRIVCYNSAHEVLGVMHVGALYGLPKDLSKTLYPGGTVEYTL